MNLAGHPLHRVPAALAVAAFLLAPSTPSIASEAGPTRVKALPREEPAGELPAAIAAILQAAPIHDARTGVLVVDLDTGREIFARNADELLNPASNMKLLTTAAALSRLGPSFRFATELYVSDAPRAGVVKGSLYLKGKGDPSLDTERLFRIARELKRQGIKEIAGNLVIDDTYFDAEYDGPGWEQDDSDRPYMAGAGAVSLNFNAVGIHVHPGEGTGATARVELEPPSDYLVLDNQAITGPPGSRSRVVANSVPDGKRQKIVVRARIATNEPGEIQYRRISDPPRYTGESFKTLLGELGVKVRGKVVLGAVPADLKPIVVDRSEPLTVLIHKLNKWSQNHMSEMLLKTLGAESRGAPGTWAKGAAAIEDFLAAEVGIPKGSLVIRNGSGLNDTNRVSARQLVRLLTWIHSRSLIEPELLASLPIAGVDGTTRNRLGGTLGEGRVRAKTGTLQNVTALSGYVDAVGGRRFAFAIVVNDYPGRLSSVLPRVDAIGAAIASVGSEAGSRSAVALAEPPPSDPTTPIDILRSRIATFGAFGRAEDPRNATFLRAALRTERDPALRAVIAEALYRADPSDPSAASAVVESFDVTTEIFGRLHVAARGGMRMPVVDSLVGLGAAGNVAAIAHLVSVAELVDPAEPLAEELSVGLAEIGRTAPDELLATLESSSHGAQSAAVGLLGRSLAGGEAFLSLPAVGAHPFSLALSRAATGPDERLASFARQVEVRLASDRHPADADRTPASVVP
ncbi:MAG TPA: D-alanyl-D-alanine carboxypeptidase/D-alanyl-D-alanine-endopeptidase [Vulgatibacter sp.]